MRKLHGHVNTSQHATRPFRLDFVVYLKHHMPFSAKAWAIRGKCPESALPLAPCPRMMPNCADSAPQESLAVCVSVLPGRWKETFVSFIPE